MASGSIAILFSCKLKRSQKQSVPDTHMHMAGTGAAPVDLHDALDSVEPKLVRDLHGGVADRPDDVVLRNLWCGRLALLLPSASR